MNYNDNLLLGIQFAYIILGLLTATVIGSIGCRIWLFLNKGTAKFYVKDAMKFLKLVLSCYLAPTIPFILFPIFKGTGNVAGAYMVKTMVKVLGIVILVWMFSVLAMLVIRFINYVFVCRMCVDNIPVEDEIVLAELNRWKEILHLRKKVTLFINPNISSPAILYHWGYQVLLPVYEMTDQELSMAILHELVHLKHNDLLTKDVCFVIQAIHGINPFVRRIKDEVARWAEVLCDLTTCEVGRDCFTRQEYYYSIQRLMSNAEKEMRNDAVLSLCETSSLLAFRVRMFAESNKDSQIRLRRMFCLVLFLMISVTTIFFGVTAVATNVWYEISLTEYQEEMKRVYEMTSKFEEMFSDVEIVKEETICTTERIEREVALNKGEVCFFLLKDHNINQVDVHVFCEQGDCILGGIKENGEIIYVKGCPVLTKKFFREEGIIKIFVKNNAHSEVLIEICIEFFDN